MSNTALSKAPRCTTHTPMSAVLMCTACNSFLCRLCVKNQRGADVCSACNGETRRLSPEELGHAARRQTDILRRASSATIPTRSEPTPALKASGVRPESKAAAPLPKSEASPPQAAAAQAAPSEAVQPPAPAAPAEEKTAGAPASFERKPPYFCKKHEKVKATRSCAHCSEYYCNGCAKMVEENPRCPDCGGQIVALLPEVQNFPPRTLSQDIHDALLFPFKGSGKLMLILGTLFMFLLHFAGSRGKALAAAYMYVYGMKICRTSATGGEAPPPWPAFGDLGGAWYFFVSWLVSRVPAVLVLIIVCAASPAILLSNSSDDSGMSGVQQAEEEDDNSGPLPGLDNQDESVRDKEARKERERQQREAKRRARAAARPNLFPYYIVSLLGDVYMPMALLALILFRTYTVLNPLFVFGSIQRVGSAYLATYITITLAHVANEIPEFLARMLEGTIAGIAIVPFVSALVFLYLLMVSMRALGVMYYYNQNKLGWFT